jgi:hypothetical protein
MVNLKAKSFLEVSNKIVAFNITPPTTHFNFASFTFQFCCNQIKCNKSNFKRRTYFHLIMMWLLKLLLNL